MFLSLSPFCHRPQLGSFFCFYACREVLCIKIQLPDSPHSARTSSGCIKKYSMVYGWWGNLSCCQLESQKHLALFILTTVHRANQYKSLWLLPLCKKSTYQKLCNLFWRHVLSAHSFSRQFSRAREGSRRRFFFSFVDQLSRGLRCLYTSLVWLEAAFPTTSR